MANKRMTNISVFFVITIFITSVNEVIGFSDVADQDTWISIVLSFLTAIPLMLLYGRLIKLMPEKNLYQMAETVFGKVAGKIISILFCGFCFTVMTMSFYTFTKFVRIFSLPQTPFIVLLFIFLVPVLYLAKTSGEVLGKICMFILAGSLTATLIVTIASIPTANLEYLQPVFNHSVSEIVKHSGSRTVISFAEVAVILGIADLFRKDLKAQRVFTFSITISSLHLLTTFLRTLLILGVESMDSMSFSTFRAVGIIKIVTFFDRAEAFIAIPYLFGGLCRACIALIATGKGLKQVFKLSSYRKFLLPIGLCTVALASVLVQHIAELNDFGIIVFLVYPVFQILIPLVLWIVAEVRFRKKGSQNKIADSDQSEKEISPQPKEALEANQVY